MLELGNMLFGHSRGEFEFPNRDIVDSDEWNNLLKKSKSDCYGHTESKSSNERGGFENDTFSIKPYWWGDDDNTTEAEAPNFLYKPTGFEIRWYKYPFRDSYMSQNLTEEEILNIFKQCLYSIM